VPQVTLEEVNKLANDFIGDTSRVVLVSGPKKPGLVYPTEDQLAAVLKGIGTSPSPPTPTPAI
jgi:hypothetical protein